MTGSEHTCRGNSLRGTERHGEAAFLCVGLWHGGGKEWQGALLMRHGHSLTRWAPLVEIPEGFLSWCNGSAALSRLSADAVQASGRKGTDGDVV